MQRGFSLILIHIYVSLIPKKKTNNSEMEFRFQTNMILIISIVLKSELYPGDFSLKGIKRR